MCFHDYRIYLINLKFLYALHIKIFENFDRNYEETVYISKENIFKFLRLCVFSMLIKVIVSLVLYFYALSNLIPTAVLNFSVFNVRKGREVENLPISILRLCFGLLVFLLRGAFS